MPDFSDPFTAAMYSQLQSGMDSGGNPGLGLFGNIVQAGRNYNRAQQETTLLGQVGDQIKQSMAGGAPLERAMMEAFRSNPTLMLEHPEIFENMGKLRDAMTPKLVGAQGGLWNPSTGQFALPPRQAQIEYPKDADGNSYVKVTQPNGNVEMTRVADKYKVIQGVDGSIYGINTTDPTDFQTIHKGPGNPKDVQFAYDKDGNMVMVDKGTGKAQPVTDQNGQPVQAQPKPTGPKAFTAAEAKQLEYAPALFDNLRDMYDMSTATGTVSGLVQRLAAKYGGINDPAQLWQVAHQQAEANMAGLNSSGRFPVAALKEVLETLPKDYQSARYGKGAVLPYAMQNLMNTAQTGLSLIEQEGKKIPQGTLDKFAAFGVYPDSQKDKDPVMKLRADPGSLSDDQLKSLARYAPGLKPEDRQLILGEMKKRQAAEASKAASTP